MSDEKIKFKPDGNEHTVKMSFDSFGRLVFSCSSPRGRAACGECRELILDRVALALEVYNEVKE